MPGALVFRAGAHRCAASVSRRGKSIRALGTSMDGLTCRPPDRTKRKSVPLRGGLDHAVANTTCLRVLRSRLRRPVDHVDADPHRGERRFRSSRSTDIPARWPKPTRCILDAAQPEEVTLDVEPAVVREPPRSPGPVAASRSSWEVLVQEQGSGRVARVSTRPRSGLVVRFDELISQA